MSDPISTSRHERLINRLRAAPDNAYLVGSCGDIKGHHLREAADLIEALQARLQGGGADAAIYAELDRAITKFPTWPTDGLHALSVLGEEFGELTKEMLQLTYEPHKSSRDEVRKEALQTAAMAIRLYRSLDTYEYKPGPQHKQDAALAASPKETTRE
jgi:hypothetical protein